MDNQNQQQPQQANDPNSKPQLSQFNTQKRLFLLIGVFLVILVGLVAYTLLVKNSKQEGIACTQEAMQCPDGSYVGRTGPNCEFSPCPTSESTPSAETADWKTYKNNAHSFEIKFPPEYVIDDHAWITFTNPDKNSNDPVSGAPYNGLTIYTVPDEQCKDIDNATYYDEKPVMSVVTVGGINSKKWVGSTHMFADPFFGDVIIKVIKSSICYSFYFVRDPRDKAGSEKLLDQILSTFKFTGQERAVDASNWKEYTDKMSRLTFKYPPDFSIKEDTGGNDNVFYADLNNTLEKFRFETGPKDYVGLYEHFRTDKIENINGTPWIVVAASEYCDAGECGPTAPGYYIKKNDYYVGILILKETQSSQTLRKILSTFKFLE